MSKQVIAVDIDDVLSDTAEGFIAFSNKQFGTTLNLNDWSEHWAEMWRVDIAEAHRRAEIYDQSETASKFTHKEEAKPVLQALKHTYKLIALTSRRNILKEQTLDWLDRHFSGIFNDVQFAGIFEGDLNLDMVKRTKGELFTSNNVDYVIDDQLKHCFAAHELGIRAVLFGDYPWNQADKLPEGVTRCTDWPTVLEYFDDRA